MKRIAALLLILAATAAFAIDGNIDGKILESSQETQHNSPRPQAVIPFNRDCLGFGAITLSIFTNAARTAHFTNSPMTVDLTTGTAYRYVYAVTNLGTSSAHELTGTHSDFYIGIAP